MCNFIKKKDFGTGVFLRILTFDNTLFEESPQGECFLKLFFFFFFFDLLIFLAANFHVSLREYAKFIFITFENYDKTCSKIEKTWFLLVGWQKSIKKWWMKNTAVIRFPQCCNLTFAPWFWAVKVCLQAKLFNNTINRPKGCNLIKKETLGNVFLWVLWNF